MDGCVHPNVGNEVTATSSRMDPDAAHQRQQVPANSGGDNVDANQPTPIIKPPELNIPQLQLVQVAKLKYQEFSVNIFTDGTSKKNPSRFFFEPVVMLDPKSITIQSQDLSKEDVVSFTIEMWNEEIRSKVLDLLRVKKLEVDENDVSVMPYEDVQLVGKPGSIHQSIQIMEDVIPYDRQNERLEFFLLCDSPSTAQNLADNLRKCPSFLVRKWQLALECRGLALNPLVADDKASSIVRPVFKLVVSTPSITGHDLRGTMETVSQSSFATELEAKMKALSNQTGISKDYDKQIEGLQAQIQGLINRTISTVEFTNPATSSEKVTAALSGAESLVDIAPAVDRRAALPQLSEVLPEASSPPVLKQLETAASNSQSVKEEKVYVAQLKLDQKPSSFSKPNCQVNEAIEVGQLDVSTVKISRCPAGARLSWKPPLSTAGEISEYTVSLAVKGNSLAQCVDTLSYARVYCGPSPECKVSNLSLSTAHIDRTKKPSIIFRIAARNDKGYGTVALVMLAWAQRHKDPSPALTPAIEAVIQSTTESQSFLNVAIKSTSPSVVQELTSSNIASVFTMDESVDVNRPASLSQTSSEQQGVTARSTLPIVRIKEEPKDEMKSCPALALKIRSLLTQVANPAEEVMQPPPSRAGCTTTGLSVKEIQTEPAPQKRPVPTPSQAVIQETVTGSTSTSSSLDNNTNSVNSGSNTAAASATFTSPISSNGSTSVAPPVPSNITQQKLNTVKNTALYTPTGTEVAEGSSYTTATILARTMEAPTASEVPASTDLKKNTTVPVKRSSQLPSSSTASKRPKPTEHQLEEVVEAPAFSSAPMSINPTLPPSFKDTRSNQSVGNRTSLTITTPTASTKIAGAANLAIASETNSAGAVVAAVAPTTSTQSELSHFEATRYSVLFFFNGDERDDIFPEDVILVLGNGNFQTDEPLWDSIVMVHLDDGLIYPGIYKGKSVTQTTSSISSKITKIAQFGVYPANFAASTLFYYDDSVASTEQLMIEAALAFVSIALMEASEAAKLSSAPVNSAVSHKSKVIDGKGEGTRYSVDILMVDGSFSNDSVLPDYVANCYDHSGNKCEQRIGCVMTVFKPNGYFNVGIFKGVPQVSTTNTAYSDGSAFAMPSPTNVSQLEAKQVHSPIGTEAAEKVVYTVITSSTSSAATTGTSTVSQFVHEKIREKRKPSSERPESSGSRPRSVADETAHSDTSEKSERTIASARCTCPRRALYFHKSSCVHHNRK